VLAPSRSGGEDVEVVTEFDRLRPRLSRAAITSTLVPLGRNTRN
jgi:hypothetical protein